MEEQTQLECADRASCDAWRAEQARQEARRKELAAQLAATLTGETRPAKGLGGDVIAEARQGSFGAVTWVAASGSVWAVRLVQGAQGWYRQAWRSTATVEQVRAAAEAGVLEMVDPVGVQR